jgi:outer membrane murein-binding lipoprotein Lpp
MADSDKVGNDKVGNDKVGQLQDMLLELTSRVASLETQVNALRGPITSTAKDEDMSKGDANMPEEKANIPPGGGRRRRSRRHSRRGKRPRKSRRH